MYGADTAFSNTLTAAYQHRRLRLNSYPITDNNHMPGKLWDGIMYPSLNSIGETVEFMNG